MALNAKEPRPARSTFGAGRGEGQQHARARARVSRARQQVKGDCARSPGHPQQQLPCPPPPHLTVDLSGTDPPRVVVALQGDETLQGGTGVTGAECSRRGAAWAGAAQRWQAAGATPPYPRPPHPHPPHPSAHLELVRLVLAEVALNLLVVLAPLVARKEALALRVSRARDGAGAGPAGGWEAWPVRLRSLSTLPQPVQQPTASVPHPLRPTPPAPPTSAGPSAAGSTQASGPSTGAGGAPGEGEGTGEGEGLGGGGSEGSGPVRVPDSNTTALPSTVKTAVRFFTASPVVMHWPAGTTVPGPLPCPGSVQPAAWAAGHSAQNSHTSEAWHCRAHSSALFTAAEPRRSTAR